jgi:4'-phosphopantetheinyl transferase
MPPEGEVHAWVVLLGAVPEPRKRSLVGHVALRLVLAELTGSAPEDLRFERRCGHCGRLGHGKPHLSGHPDLDFSLSHSGGLALIAVARGRRVGADVERLRPRTDVLAIARGSLSARERRVVEGGETDAARRGETDAARRGETDAARREAFFRCWTRKEAYLKGLGVGLAGGLDSDPDDAPGWQVRSLPAPPGYAAAVAAEGQFALRQRTTLWPPNPKLFESPTAPRPLRVRSPSARAPLVT